MYISAKNPGLHRDVSNIFISTDEEYMKYANGNKLVELLKDNNSDQNIIKMLRKHFNYFTDVSYKEGNNYITL